MKKYLFIILLNLSLIFNPLYSQEKEIPKNTPYDNKYWEGISIDILVKELLEDAKKEGLKNFDAYARDNYISILYRDIIFKPDSPELTDETKVKLKILVKILKKFAGKTFFIEGHTHKVPGEEALGLVLSKKRADTVAEFLSSTEIFKETKFLTKGYGDTQPVSQTVHSLNRRVEISIVDKIEDKADDKKENNTERKNIWWKTLTNDKSPGYTVIILKNEAKNKGIIIKLLNGRNLKYTIYENGKDLIIIYDNVKFTNDGNDLDENSKNNLKALADIINKYRTVVIRIGGEKDNEINEAIKKQYIVALYFYNNSETLKPENVYYSYNEESLYKDKNIETRKRAGGFNGETFKFNDLIESVDCSVIESNPLGRLREFSLAGLGIGFMINLKIPPLNKIPIASRLRISAEANGLYHFPEPTSSVEGLWEFSWDIGFGAKFVDITYFSFLLRTKYGGVINFLTATRQDYGYVTGKPFYDQTVSIESEFDIKTKKRDEKDKLIISVFLTPGYRLFFNKDYLGHTIYEKTGIRFNF